MRGSIRLAGLAAIAGLVICSLSTDARAGTVFAQWVAPVSGDWTDPARWHTSPFYPDNGNPAESVYNALIDVQGPDYTVTSSQDVAVQRVSLQSPSALLEQVGGSLTTQFLSVGDVGTGHYRIAAGTIDVNGLTIGARFSPTADVGEGLFEQLGGRVNNTGTWTYIGHHGGSGTLSVSGLQSRYTAAPPSGSLAGLHLIGHGSLSRGVAHFRNNASVTLGSTEVGAAGGTGTLVVETGARVFVNGLHVGRSLLSSSQYGDGTVILGGGHLTIGPGHPTAAHPIVGGDAGSANIIVNGGTLTIQPFGVMPGSIFIMRNGTFTANSGVVESHRQSFVAGQFIISGGAVTAPAFVVSLTSPDTPDAGRLTLNAGRLTTTGWVELNGGHYVQTGGAAALGGMRLRTLSDAPTARPDARLSGGSYDVAALYINAGTFTYDGGTFNSDWMDMTAGRFVATPGRDKTVRVGTLSMSGDSRLDLGDNVMVLDSGEAPPVATIRALIRSGYHAGAWDGPGIMSSTAQISPGYGIGYMQPSPLFTPLLIAYTRYGDANLDGLVNLADFNRLAANFGSTSATWSMGDFNYDGLVNLADFNRLAANFGLVAAGTDAPTPEDWSALAAVVPEPSILTILAVPALAGMVRRRRPARAKMA